MNAFLHDPSTALQIALVGGLTVVLTLAAWLVFLLACREEAHIRGVGLALCLGCLVLMPALGFLSTVTGVGWTWSLTDEETKEDLELPLPAAMPETDLGFAGLFPPHQAADEKATDPASKESWWRGAWMRFWKDGAWWPQVMNGFGLIWAAGAVMAMARLATGLLHVRRLLGQTRPLTKDEAAKLSTSHREIADGLLESLRLTPLPLVPFLAGFRRPRIVLPESLLNELAPEKLSLILRHEFSHRAQGDQWLALLQNAAVCLHWWNPLVHMLSQSLTQAREEMSDAAVVAREPQAVRQDYGELLLRIAESCARPPRHACALAATSTYQSLRRRLVRLRSLGEAGYRRPSRWAVAGGAVAAGLLASLGCGQIAAQTPPAAEEPLPPILGEPPQAPSPTPSVEKTTPSSPRDEPLHQIALHCRLMEVKAAEASSSQWPDRHRTYTTEEFESFTRWANEQASVSLLSAPSVVAWDAQPARVEVIRTMVLTGSRAPGQETDASTLKEVPVGAFVELTAQLEADHRLRLTGQATLREVDAKDESPGLKPPGPIVSFNTVETYFDTQLQSGETQLIACRTSPSQKNRLYLTITAEDLGPTPASRPLADVEGLSIYLQARTLDYAKIAGENNPMGDWMGSQSEDSADPSTPLVKGVFTDPQVQVVYRALKVSRNIVIPEPEAAIIGPELPSLPLKEAPLVLTPLLGADGMTVTLDLEYQTGTEPNHKVTTSVTFWEGHTVLCYLPVENKLLFVSAQAMPKE